jgi:hypothetical protein
MSRRRTIIISLAFFATLFIVTAIIQYLFIRNTISQMAGERLDYLADDLRTTLDQGDKLDLAALRRTSPKAAAFVVLASDGTVIDIHGFVTGSIVYAALPAGSAYDHLVRVRSSEGEEWYLLAKKVKGGSVIVGASSIQSPPDISTRLLDSVKQFGNTVESATDPELRDPHMSVDFAVLDDDGILLADDGGIPLKAKKTGLLFTGDGPIITVSGTTFLVHKVAIIDRAKRQRATILVTRDVELEEEMLHESLVFNIAVAAVSLLLCGLLIWWDFRVGRSI